MPGGSEKTLADASMAAYRAPTEPLGEGASDPTQRLPIAEMLTRAPVIRERL
jgi:hypothetical protein